MPTSIEIQPGQDNIPLSFSQEHVWLTEHLASNIQLRNHLSVVLKLKGKLNINGLSRSLQTIVERHEVLRSFIQEKAGKPYQKIQDYKNWSLTKTRVSHYNNETIQIFIQQIINAPFDLSGDYLLRADLLVVNEEDHLLVVTMHTHASDDQSVSLIIKELVELYSSIEECRPSTLSALPIQYSDYTIWQRKYYQGVLLDNKIGYWKEKLKDISTLQLPQDFARPGIQSTRCASVAFSIDQELANQLQLLCKEQGDTLFMTLLAAFKVLLHRYSGQQDICVGTPVAGRQQKEVEGLIGSFENMLALRSEVSDDVSFAEFLRQVKNTTMEAYEYQEPPFEKVVEVLVKDSNLEHRPIFRVMFGLDNKPVNHELKLKELTLSVEKLETKISRYDISFFINRTANNLAGTVVYCTDLYKEETIIRMIDHYKELLRSVLKTPHQSFII